MDLSVIIVSFNTQNLLERCLSSLQKILKEASFTNEVIVIDNGSRDGTREMLKKFPWVRAIFNRENAGFGRANNQGIRLAKGEYILLLNSDTEVLDAAVEKLLKFAQNHPRAFVGSQLLNPDRSPQASCGPFLTLPVVFAALFLRGDKIGLTRWSPRKARQVDWVSGACLLGAKKLFQDNLWFDEKIFMYMEEIDLLYRARRRGILTYFYPEAKVIHAGSGSSINKKKGPVLNIYRGLVYFYRKHYGGFRLALLKILLKLKAIIALILGILTSDAYLRETYAEAYQLV